MPGFRVFMSNRMERLADALADELRAPLSSPFDHEIIVVQSRGMEKWLALELANRAGIFANFRFPFPRGVVSALVEAAIPDVSREGPYEPGLMTWRIMKILPGFLDAPAFESLRKYLHGECASLRLYQLSRRISSVFDQYLVFRPEMVLSWDQGKDSQWQAVLWRELVRDIGGKPHMASLGKDFIDAMTDNRPCNFPERISVFGISTLPPVYLNILYAASAKTRLNLFLMAPCREYWGDIVSRREAAEIVSRASLKGDGRADLHIGEGNSVLASTGAAGREFIDALMELPSLEENEVFEEPAGESMLCRLQSDILNLEEAGEAMSGKRKVPGSDLSIQIHSCHSPMREMEVLQDILIDMFEKDPGLMPGDVLVMTQDIETCAPFIHAVFDLPEGDPRKIPYRVADRSSADDQLALDTFMMILDLPAERFGVSRVMEIIRSPMVARKFQWDEKGLQIIEDLVRGSGIRWGLDGAGKEAMGLPRRRENTWEAGLDRLLLGFAMPGFNERIFKGVVPYDHIEGKDSEILGNLMYFVEKLRFLEKDFGASHTPGEWSAILTGVLEVFFEDGGGESLRKLQEGISGLSSLEEDSGFQDPLELSVVKEHLGYLLEGEGLGRGFLDSGMTFCAMVPMRSIPRRIICLAGLNSESFPGRSSTADFDLIASSPKRCDRSRRKDDRYLFLEALLSARDTLCITYVGQDIKDNSTIPPSVLVSDLMDYLERSFAPDGGGGILDQAVTHHRLQAFSPAYFEGGRLFSYSKANFDAARALCNQSAGEAPFISSPLPYQEETLGSVGIQSFCSFFANPSKFMLKRRLGIHLEGVEAALEDEELFELTGLERYRIAQELLEKRMDRKELEYVYPIKKAAGELPDGNMGRLDYYAIAGRSQDLADSVEDLIKQEKKMSLTLDLKVSDIILSGTVKGVYGARLIRCRNAAIGGKDRIRIWIELLFLCCADPENRPLAGVLAGWGKKPELIEIKAPEMARDLLWELMDIYKEGVKMPLKFFPEASWRYALDVSSRGVPPEKALSRAVAAWGNDYAKSSEKDDPYVRLCFGTDSPLDETFQRMSMKIFAPVISAEAGI